MVDNLKLEQGKIIEFENKSYIIMAIYSLAGGKEIDEFDLIVERVSCKRCAGNLKKQGNKRGQVKCVDCDLLQYLDESGNEGA